MDRLPLIGDDWCSKCPSAATHTRMVSIGGSAPQRVAYCDTCAWPLVNRQKGGQR